MSFLDSPNMLGRNPLSLDMGWESKQRSDFRMAETWSQSAFAGYGLGESIEAPKVLKLIILSTFFLRKFKPCLVKSSLKLSL